MPAPQVKPKIIVICGPTGVGKTAAAIKIAHAFNGHIIGADSMQVYRQMDIGTAKPTLEEQARVPHHMIDIVDPNEPFDAVKFAALAREKIFQLHAQRIPAFVVGGTGLYIKALLCGMFRSRPIDESISRRLKKEASVYGSDFVYRRLQKVDPAAAARLHPNDGYRILRALEVFEATGISIARYHREHDFSDRPFSALKIGLNLNRKTLYDRIDRRVDAMLASGLVDEVKQLLENGYTADLKAMQSIGYRHLVDFLAEKIAWDECVRTLKRDTRRYAKRQLTWFRADDQIIWQTPQQVKNATKLVEKFLQASDE